MLLRLLQLLMTIQRNLYLDRDSTITNALTAMQQRMPFLCPIVFTAAVHRTTLRTLLDIYSRSAFILSYTRWVNSKQSNPIGGDGRHTIPNNAIQKARWPEHSQYIKPPAVVFCSVRGGSKSCPISLSPLSTARLLPTSNKRLPIYIYSSNFVSVSSW